MSLHPDFPASPYAPLLPEHRWFPADEALRASAYEKLLPPLVAKIRKEVYEWHNKEYEGATTTSRALLEWWFETDHQVENADGSLSTFRYYFAQREAVETVIWLHDVKHARDKFDLLRFDASGAVSHGMFSEDWPRYVTKMATGAGKSEGVPLEYVPMGGGTERKDSIVVEVDAENPNKNLDALDITLPKMTRRFQRDFKELDELNPAALGNKVILLKPFTPDETREIVFKTMLDAEVHHTIHLDGAGPADYRSVVAFFARQLLKKLRLVGGYDVLYGKVKTFLREHLFASSPVDLEDAVVMRNLSEPEAGKIIFDSFKASINALTVQDAGSSWIEDRIRLRETRPFRTEHRAYLAAKKSIFNRIVGEPHSGGFELTFASFLESASDVTSFAKNYLAVGFKFDCVKADGDLSTYTPDFIVKTTDGKVWIVETKGRKELDLPQKMTRLRQWCEDATAASADEDGVKYGFVFVDQDGFDLHQPKTFASLNTSFTDYRA